MENYPYNKKISANWYQSAENAIIPQQTEFRLLQDSYPLVIKIDSPQDLFN